MTDAELRKLIHKMQQDNAAGGIERFRDVRSFRYQDVEDLVNAAGSLLDDRDRLAAENARLRAALEIFDSIMIDTYRRPDDMARHRDGEESAFCIAWKSAREALARKEGRDERA